MHGVAVLQRRVSRARLLAVVAQIPRCEVVMEACGGAHYWARAIRCVFHAIVNAVSTGW